MDRKTDEVLNPANITNLYNENADPNIFGSIKLLIMAKIAGLASGTKFIDISTIVIDQSVVCDINKIYDANNAQGTKIMGTL